MSTHTLIVGQCPDPHIDAVVKQLRERSAAVTVLDRLRPDHQALTYRYTGPAHGGSLRSDGAALDLAAVSAVWWRVKPFTIAELTGAPAPLAEGFVDREWRTALDSLPAFTPSARWMNPRAADQRARNKPIQLAEAQAVGLSIPATVVANDPVAVEELFEHGCEHIYKPLTWYIEPPTGLLYTASTSATDVAANQDAIRLAPGIFQRRIDKSYEVRVTVIRERVFAVRIDAQANRATRLDWRRDQRSVGYEAIDLDCDTTDRLHRLQSNLGLVYGAHDLIVTPDGEVVFLEVNPLGQWLWLEHATDLPISAALADELTR